MSAIPSTTVNNAVVTRLRKKRDLETTMNTLKQLLEPTMKKGSRKKNKPRSLAKKVVPPQKPSRYENTMDGEFYPNKLKRKVRLNKTVLRPKHEMKIVVATNKRKRCTPHKGLNHEELINWQNNAVKTNTNSCNENNKYTEARNLCINEEHLDRTQNIYKLISPPHRSLTRMTVDDLIRMDEDSLSGEDMMEILTCPSPVWWEDIDTDQGNVFLTQSSDLKIIKHEVSKDGMGQKRGPLVSVTKARKIAKLENVLGHIKSLVNADTKDKTDRTPKNDVNNKLKDIENATKDKATNIDRPEVTDNRKIRKVSSSGSEISVNEEVLLRDLQNINIPIAEDKYNDTDTVKNDVKTDFKVQSDKGKESDKTRNEKNKSKRQRAKRVLKNKAKIKPPVTKKQKKHKDDVNPDEKQHINNKEVDKPLEPNKSILEKLKRNNDILDVRLIKIPTNVTNEVKVWSKLENFKRHNFKPSDFDKNIDECEIPITCKKTKEQDPLELNDETILIDDDSNDTGMDIVNINVKETHVTLTPTSEFCNTKVNDSKTETQDSEISIIKEDTIRIGNDLDVRLIETSDHTNKRIDPEKNVTKRIENTIRKYNTKRWHVNKYLKYDDKTNDRGIFRVDDSDTILCLKDVNVSLVQKPHKAEVKVSESKNDLSITLISKSVDKVTITPMKHESPKYMNDDVDTISDTNVQFLDEYDGKSGKEVCNEARTK